MGGKPFLCTSALHLSVQLASLASSPRITALQAKSWWVGARGPCMWPLHPPMGRHTACLSPMHMTPSPACRFMLGEEPAPHLTSLLCHAALFTPLWSPCLVRSLFASEVVSLSFVHSTAPVKAFDFCCRYCKETQILCIHSKIYTKH